MKTLFTFIIALCAVSAAYAETKVLKVEMNAEVYRSPEFQDHITAGWATAELTLVEGGGCELNVYGHQLPCELKKSGDVYFTSFRATELLNTFCSLRRPCTGNGSIATLTAAMETKATDTIHLVIGRTTTYHTYSGDSVAAELTFETGSIE